MTTGPGRAAASATRRPLYLAAGAVARGGFEERLAAAAGAGFDGVGLLNAPYLAARAAGRSDADLRAMLAHHGQKVVDLQPLPEWSLGGAAGRQSRAAETTAYRLAAALGGDHLLAVGHDLDAPHDVVVERFAALCDRAADYGLRVGLEFMPWTAIATPADAWGIVVAAGRPNAGVVVDPWHVFRGSGDLAELDVIPGERVVAVHFDDGDAPVGDPLDDTRRNRRLPGEGGFPLDRFVDKLDAMGVVAPWCVEILSEALDATPVPEAMRLSARHSRDVLEARPPRPQV